IFYLRKNAKWSDGKPVTAHDFVFSWRMTLDPKTASEYAFFLYPIKNAEAINQGKLAGTELGAKAVDDYTLKIDFEKPCGYFLGITAFPTLYPVREDFYNQRKDRYAADASDLLSNGPFVLTKWLHGASLQLDKNQYYWDKNRIKVSRIDIPYITPDNNALFNLFKDKKIDMLTPIPKDDLPKAQREGFDMKSFADGSIFFMEFNFREGRAVVNKNLRKALQAVFDPKELVNKVIGIPGTKPGYYLIPTWLKGVKSSFRKEFPLVQNKKNIAEGKKYLALAMKELGLKTPPSLIWLTGDTVTTAKEAEYFQNLFKTTLGIDLKIDKQIFKQRLAKMTAGEFDIVAAGWGPDYADPMTFADLWTSWNENNRGKYSNPAYDKLIREAQATADPKKRMNAMAQAEKIGLDDLVVIPTYERTVVYLEHPWIKDVVRHSIGPDPDFTWVSVNK
ncbi:MAG: peptide ABC transporter substrate-binding protein, partial [Deltaproteobacteria bacterium]|nr:peptide ABC transporter substrate-binding protein [Deltaproteobacteria bacterium]